MARALPSLRRRAIRLIGLILISPVMTLCSCASGDYCTDRGKDALDIFTLTVGTGLGAKVRAGPLHAGLFAGGDAYGLRGGTWGSQETRKGDAPVPDDFDILVESWEKYNASKPYERDKNFSAHGGPLLCVATGNPAYYSQIEVAVALMGELRVGVNPGEFLDFVLGFTMLDIYGDDIRWKTRFARAVADGNTDKVATLLRRGANVDAAVYGGTALHFAVEHEYWEMARALLAAGANANARDFEEATPLHLACKLKSGVSQHFVELMLENGAHVEVADRYNRTPLLFAVESANLELVRLLLSEKANPNIKSISGERPLKLAQAKGLTDIADLLRQNGAVE